MRIIDRVAYEPEKTGDSRDENLFVWRYPSEDLTLGTQLIVNQSQEAIFFKGGQALDLFGPGTHTLAADNLPLISKLVNLPFGGQTPFTAEVYFVNRHSKLDMKWGTQDPFRLTDPVYHIIIPIRSHGQLGIRVSDSRSLVTQLVGTLHQWKADKVLEYFKGIVVSKTKDKISDYILTKKVSVMDISSRLSDISSIVAREVHAEFNRFGIEVVNFFVTSINVPDEDPSVLKIQEIMASRAEFEQLGENYRVKRTFDTLEKAASNEGGAAGALLSGGFGAGMGLGAGASVGTAFGSALSQGTSAPNIQPAERLAIIKNLFDKGLISEAEFNEKRSKVLEEL